MRSTTAHNILLPYIYTILCFYFCHVDFSDAFQMLQSRNYNQMNIRMRNKLNMKIPDPLPSCFTPSSSSSFEQQLPAGLRGEAVRSSLCDSTRGIFYNLSNGSGFNCGITHVKGKGTLDFLHSKFTNSFQRSDLLFDNDLNNNDGSEEDEVVVVVKDACYLSPRGRIIDKVTIVVLLSSSKEKEKEEAYIITSPYHGSQLYKQLDSFVFPMDGIQLTDVSDKYDVFCVASTSLMNAQSILLNNNIHMTEFPNNNNKVRIKGRPGCIWNKDIIVLQDSLMLPSCAARGYTLLVPTNQREVVYNSLTNTNDDNDSLPLEIKCLEWDSLRIESGYPTFGYEYDLKQEKQKQQEKEGKKPVDEVLFKASPLELFLQDEDTIDLDKGCYQGQEGISALLKNKRGLPRTFYSVVFDDDDNEWADLEEDTTIDDEVENLTLRPQKGDELYVLGSNEQIKVGQITSVAEAGSTGKPVQMALALIKRPGPILKKMQDLDLDFGSEDEGDELYNDENNEGFVNPPPRDPLHGLEVIIKGTYTIGKLQVLARRKFGVGVNRNKNMFVVETDGDEKNQQEDNEIPSTIMGYVPTTATGITTSSSSSLEDQSFVVNDSVDEKDSSENNEDQADQELAKAIEEAELAAAEAKRKAEKM